MINECHLILNFLVKNYIYNRGKDYLKIRINKQKQFSYCTKKINFILYEFIKENFLMKLAIQEQYLE